MSTGRKTCTRERCETSRGVTLHSLLLLVRSRPVAHFFVVLFTGSLFFSFRPVIVIVIIITVVTIRRITILLITIVTVIRVIVIVIIIRKY